MWSIILVGETDPNKSCFITSEFFYQKPKFKYFAKFDRDAMTNIVVVQFVSDIQTNMDIKYNLTCVTRGPGSATVTSGLIGAGYRESFFFFFFQKIDVALVFFK